VDVDFFLSNTVDAALRRDAIAYCIITLAELLKKLGLDGRMDIKLRVSWWLRLRARFAHEQQKIDWEKVIEGHFMENLNQVDREMNLMFDTQRELQQ